MKEEWKELKEALKEESKTRRWGNYERAVARLEELGIRCQWPSDTHCVISEGGKVWDYWPTTGKWSRREKGKPQRFARGIQSLLADIKRVKDDQPTPQPREGA